MKTRARTALCSQRDAQSEPLAQVAARFDPLTREVERLSRSASPTGVYAYCFCCRH